MAGCSVSHRLEVAHERLSRSNRDDTALVLPDAVALSVQLAATDAYARPVRRALSLAVVAACANAGAAASAPPGRHQLLPVWVERCSFRSTESIVRRVALRIAPSTTVRLAKPFHDTPALGLNGYVFPVLGPYPPFADTFGAPRDVGWHHGDDLFAPRGSSVLAVADGVVVSVGWNVGGRRPSLLDGSGNLFYYAHLQRYSPLAVDGRRVRAGQTLGYVGTTGDTAHTPPHLFFEINPASLRGLGYDGAVDPTRFSAAGVSSRCLSQHHRTRP
jgi:murein DD-endopeptidase MepM/ murein hydrolase activator NlpD